MLAIKPFRYLIVCPAVMREAGREWEAWKAEPAGV
jgi:hypothetical protein